MSEEFRAVIAEIVAIDPKTLVRKDELGTLCFESDLPLFQRCIALAEVIRTIEGEDIESPPFGWEFLAQGDQPYRRGVPKAFDLASVIRQSFKEVKDFKLQGNAAETKGQIIQRMQQAFSGLIQFLSPTLILKALDPSSALSVKEVGAKAAQEALNKVEESLGAEKSALIEATESAKKEAASIKAKSEEIQRILSAAQKAAADVGIQQEARHFKEEADAHTKVSKTWLAATVILSSVTVAFAAFGLIWVYFIDTTDTSPTRALQIAIPKLVILSLLYAATVWAGRNYKAHCHNSVVNRHRQNALSCFETFANGTEDDATKNTVLVEATRSIFAPQPSGYMTKEPDLRGGSQVIEVMKATMPENR